MEATSSIESAAKATTRRRSGLVEGVIAATRPARRRKPVRQQTLTQKLVALRLLAGKEREDAEVRFIRAAGGMQPRRGFVGTVTRWFRGDDVDDDDLASVATAALWQAMRDWREDGGSPFDSFARWRLRTACRSLLAGSRIVRGRASRSVELDEQTTDEGVSGGGEEAVVAGEVRATLAAMEPDGRQVLEALMRDDLEGYGAARGMDAAAVEAVLDEAKAEFIRLRRRGRVRP